MTPLKCILFQSWFLMLCQFLLIFNGEPRCQRLQGLCWNGSGSHFLFSFPFIYVCSHLSSFSSLISLTFPTVSVFYVPLFMSFKIHVCVCAFIFDLYKWYRIIDFMLFFFLPLRTIAFFFLCHLIVTGSNAGSYVAFSCISFFFLNET